MRNRRPAGRAEKLVARAALLQCDEAVHIARIGERVEFPAPGRWRGRDVTPQLQEERRDAVGIVERPRRIEVVFVEAFEVDFQPDLEADQFVA